MGLGISSTFSWRINKMFTYTIYESLSLGNIFHTKWVSQVKSVGIKTIYFDLICLCALLLRAAFELFCLNYIFASWSGMCQNISSCLDGDYNNGINAIIVLLLSFQRIWLPTLLDVFVKDTIVLHAVVVEVVVDLLHLMYFSHSHTICNCSKNENELYVHMYVDFFLYFHLFYHRNF